MAQETELWEKEHSTQREPHIERTKDEALTGRDMPSGDGDVGDEQVNRLNDGGSDQRTGQDHSTDNYENTEPRDGVGAIQDANLVGTDIADISE